MSVSKNSLLNSDAFCILPWVHLHVNEQGKSRACCISKINYGNINHQSPEEIWNSETIKKTRLQFLNHQKDNRCKNCYSLEESGKQSLRQKYNKQFQTSFPKVSKTSPSGEVNSPPIYYDIRFSNVCNFKCRTCWHGASSSWFEDAKKLKRHLNDRAILNNITDSNQFFTAITPWLSSCEEIYFAGGEPLVMVEHYELLDLLIKHKLFHIRLKYNTNFSQLNFKKQSILQLWQHFEHVELGISIDGTHKQGEYIRSGFSWKTFLHNFSQLQNHQNIKYAINPTVSIMNIYHITSMHKYFIENLNVSPNNFDLNILQQPSHFNIQSLPEIDKEEIKLQLLTHLYYLEKINASTDIINQYNGLISYMKLTQIKVKQGLLNKELTQLDLIRKEDFNISLPEIIHLV